MASQTLNIITTSLLTALCSLILFILYRRAIRPIIKKYHSVPLRTFREYRDRINGGYRDVPQSEEEEVGGSARRISRDLEEGFRDDSDEEEDAAGFGETLRDRIHGSPEERRGSPDGVGLGIRM
ncbi:hypothetical protein BJ508DRAFT_378376 [Ascobolus immersus RN42]|uniref:Uncharacterized protein n=1 Tax=Ascobolus immersus RN42 TaxID=1160509 RepID=A0A3N4I2C1_ASCIM|nr:hypothetical protein BJ508DRAFT_378376 [Ascobolus immersus RN42]